MLEFEIPHHTARLSDIFGSLESARTQLDIQDYSVSQTSLDKVSTHQGLEVAFRD